MRYRILDTPTGPFVVIEHDGGRLRTAWVSGADDPLLAGGRADAALRPELAAQLARYFAGADADFSAVPLPDEPGGGGGVFRLRCWRACRAIPRGATRTYGELATMAGGSPGAARAAGQAMRHNPLPIVIPCHRVLAAGGRLGGFGGHTDPRDRAVAVKRWLLAMEGALDSELSFEGSGHPCS